MNDKYSSQLSGRVASLPSISMRVHPSSSISPSSICSSLALNVLIVWIILTSSTENASRSVLRDIMLLGKMCVLIVDKAIIGMEQHASRNAHKINSSILLWMNVSALLVWTGTALSVYPVLVAKSSTPPRTSVNALKTPDGMDMAVLPLRSVRMVKNGMCLSSCVSVLSIVIGMEHIVWRW